MPEGDVTTIGDLIYYQHAKIVAPSAFAVPDGTSAKGHFYGFIKKHTFHELHKKLFPYLRHPLGPLGGLMEPAFLECDR